MKLKDIFTIEYGQREYHSKEGLKSGKSIMISSQSTDNGCYGFFDVPVRYKAPFITIQSTGSVGEATVQEFDCCVDDNCLVLMPKEKITLTSLYFIAAVLRLSKWRFSYGGRKVTPPRIEEMDIPNMKSPIEYEDVVKELSGFITHTE